MDPFILAETSGVHPTRAATPVILADARSASALANPASRRHPPAREPEEGHVLHARPARAIAGGLDARVVGLDADDVLGERGESDRRGPEAAAEVEDAPAAQERRQRGGVRLLEAEDGLPGLL